MALPAIPVNVVSRKRKREWENDMDATRGLEFESSSFLSYKRFCQDLDMGCLDVQEELEAELFEEELISDFMKSLEKEIQAEPASSSLSCSSAWDDVRYKNEYEYGGISSVSSNTAEEEERGGRSDGVDIEYLLEASDNELGIPPSPRTGLQQLTTQEEVDNLFENGTEDLLQLCMHSNAHGEIEIKEESVGFFNEGEYWMPRQMSGGLFEMPYL